MNNRKSEAVEKEDWHSLRNHLKLNENELSREIIDV